MIKYNCYVTNIFYRERINTMPPKVKFTKEEILKAAILIIERDGYESLTIRALSQELNCSTHPIMTCFSSIEVLKMAVFEEVDKMFSGYIMENMDSPTNIGYAIALKYIEFAKIKLNLFKFLYFVDDFEKPYSKDFIQEDDFFYFLKEAMGFSYDETKIFFSCLWILVHGMATVISTNTYVLSDKQIEDYLTFSFKALQDRVISERE